MISSQVIHTLCNLQRSGYLWSLSVVSHCSHIHFATYSDLGICEVSLWSLTVHTHTLQPTAIWVSVKSLCGLSLFTHTLCNLKRSRYLWSLSVVSHCSYTHLATYSDLGICEVSLWSLTVHTYTLQPTAIWVSVKSLCGLSLFIHTLCNLQQSGYLWSLSVVSHCSHTHFAT